MEHRSAPTRLAKFSTPVRNLWLANSEGFDRRGLKRSLSSWVLRGDGDFLTRPLNVHRSLSPSVDITLLRRVSPCYLHDDLNSFRVKSQTWSESVYKTRVLRSCLWELADPCLHSCFFFHTDSPLPGASIACDMYLSKFPHLKFIFELRISAFCTRT